ncbi:translation initiation factor IF-3 [Paucidesulfovibrio gracilis]|uniref:translation initiation factor IF-3 n=1 Tax=Paucidesulfovibrio gracilis TaxID=47158 RepID=UPI000999444C|nr:translation initiation factor IF-3 [Paucidesulfovibrio gracilis]
MAFRRQDRRFPRKDDGVRRNERIRIPKVRVVDEDGNQLGILPTHEALSLARERGLDLVEVAASADPPVCRIMDYGRFKYQQQKRQQEAKKKQTVIQIKEVKFRPKTDEHDYQTKLRNIVKFLEKGDRCKVTVFFRGREIVHKDRGLMVLERVIEDTKEISKVEQTPSAEGRTMTMLLSPVKK